MLRAVTCCAALFMYAYAEQPEEAWNRFRGPLGSGVASSTGMPAELGSERTLLWRVPVLRGKSSPVLSGDRLFLTAWRGDERLVLCLDRSTGKVIWQRSVPRRHTQTMHSLNDPAAPTPAVDGRSVYAFFPDSGLVSFDKTGRRRWYAELGPFASVHGIGASPVVASGLVILPIEQQAGGSTLTAWDGSHGSIRWRKALADTGQQGYGTPFIYSAEGETPQIVYSRPGEIGGWSLASGDALWYVRGTGTQTYSSPAVGQGVIFAAADGDTVEDGMKAWGEFLEKANRTRERSLRVNEDWPNDTLARADQTFGNNDGVLDEDEWRFLIRNNKQKTLTAVRLKGRGDVSNTHVLWQTSRAVPTVSSPICVSDILFYVRDGGIFTAMDARSGKVIKEGRLEGGADKFYSSPVAADGKIYIATEQGKLVVIRAAPDWQVLSVHDFKEEIYATPAIAADGRIYVRTSQALYCFGQRK
jgi:outer membrane protein assembly factor BamB